AYETATAHFDTNLLFCALPDAGSSEQQGLYHTTNNMVIQDVVAMISPNNPAFSGTRALDISSKVTEPESGNPVNNTADNVVGVAGQSGAGCGPGFTCTNIRTGTSIAAAIGANNSMFTAVPGICKRYVNGVLTDEPLWPWPMNQRIKDALVQSRRAPVDITQTMEELLGPIPQACTTGAPPSVATLTPRNLRVIGVSGSLGE